MFTYFNSSLYRVKKNSDQKGKNSFLFIDLLDFSFGVACVASLSRSCAQVGERAKKNRMERGRGEDLFLFSPSHSPSFLLFALVPTFSTNSRGNVCYAGYFQGFVIIVVLVI